MSLPAVEQFTDTNGVQIESHGTNWSLNTGALDIQTNGLCADGSAAESAAFWDADAFPDDQYAQAVVSDAGNGVSGEGIGVTVRNGGVGVATYYGIYFVASGSQLMLFKSVAGTWEQLGSTGSASLTANDVIRIEAVGGTITPLINGSQTGTPGAQSDSSITAGSAGVTGWEDGVEKRIDDWEAGDASPPPVDLNMPEFTSREGPSAFV